MNARQGRQVRPTGRGAHVEWCNFWEGENFEFDMKSLQKASFYADDTRQQRIFWSLVTSRKVDNNLFSWTETKRMIKKRIERRYVGAKKIPTCRLYAPGILMRMMRLLLHGEIRFILKKVCHGHEKIPPAGRKVSKERPFQCIACSTRMLFAFWLHNQQQHGTVWRVRKCEEIDGKKHAPAVHTCGYLSRTLKLITRSSRGRWTDGPEQCIFLCGGTSSAYPSTSDAVLERLGVSVSLFFFLLSFLAWTGAPKAAHAWFHFIARECVSKGATKCDSFIEVADMLWLRSSLISGCIVRPNPFLCHRGRRCHRL